MVFTFPESSGLGQGERSTRATSAGAECHCLQECPYPEHAFAQLRFAKSREPLSLRGTSPLQHHPSECPRTHQARLPVK